MKYYKKLFSYLKPHLGLLIFAFTCMILSSFLRGVSLGVIVPLVDIILLDRTVTLPAWLPEQLAGVVQAFLSQEPGTKLRWMGIAIFALFVLKDAVLYCQAVFMGNGAARFVRDLRNAIYSKYHQISLKSYSGERTGELVSRVTNDAYILHNALTTGVTDLIYQTAQVLVYGAIAVAINWKLALIVLVILPALGYPIIQIGKILRKLGHLVQERMADMNARLIETLQGMKIIKAFTAETRETDKFETVNQQFFKAHMSTLRRQEALAAITELISVAGILVVMLVGGNLVVSNELSPGTFIVFLGALLSMTRPLKKLSRLHAIHQQALTAAQRVVFVLDKKPAIPDDAQAIDLPPIQKGIRFDHVTFTYQTEPVLDEFDLTIYAGETIAVVGPSGAGKTTLANLLLRFYDPDDGNISIDGHDLTDVKVESLRQQMGYVSQESFLFHESIRDNIAFGVPDATDEQIVAAARAANAHEFIQELEEGYDTTVGEQGFKLSGGQRQRLAIARAILKDPPLLILDEATSQLDSESEALVQDALERLLKGRTAVVIAHRLSTIRNADRIVVLDQGQMVQVGTHEELMQGCELYQRLYELQMAPVASSANS